MIAPQLYGAALVVIALVELLHPGAQLYTAGWFNVLIVALIVLLGVATASAVRRIESRPARAAAVVAAFAAGVCGLTTVVSGLLGPDAQTVVAAPGQTVRIEELGGSLIFPLHDASGSSEVMLERGSRAEAIGGRRFDGSFVLVRKMRTVVSVDATDRRGGHLTVTQPTGAAFLSPVLLMQATQPIAGMIVPYDSFSVPAAHRVVKVILFSAEQAAHLPALQTSEPAVLFDVENAKEREVPGGIGPARNGVRVVLAGIGLRPTIFDYPAVRIISVPNLPVTLVAAVLALAALSAAWVMARAKSATMVQAL